MNKGKEKAESSKTALSRPQQTYKSIFQKDEKTLREEILSTVPEEKQLRKDAYELAVKTTSAKEYIYPYIPISTIWISPIEKKYGHLAAEEVINFYLKNSTDPYLYPKDFQFYQDILTYTGSVHYDSTIRTGGDWAFSKATIIKIITPEQWNDDLYKTKELIINSKNPYKSKIYFNYFEYIKAWEISLCYENRQRKHSWFIQFKEQKSLSYPNWFLTWFSNFGLYPIILPNKVRTFYEEFVQTNPSMKNHGVIFTILYQIPWIIRWDAIIVPRTMQKLGLIFDNMPYLGRRIMIKWWDRYEFFESPIYIEKGLINLETPTIKVSPSPKREVSEMIKELLTSSSKQLIKDQIRAMLEADDEEELMSTGSEM